MVLGESKGKHTFLRNFCLFFRYMPISYLTNVRFAVYNKQYEVKFLYQPSTDSTALRIGKWKRKKRKNIFT